MGSKIGGLFTIVLLVFLVSNFSYLLKRMFLGQDDTIKSWTRANSLKDGESMVDVSGTHFLPSLELVIQPYAPDFDIDSTIVSEEHGVDILKLSKYIEVGLVIEKRDVD